MHESSGLEERDQWGASSFSRMSDIEQVQRAGRLPLVVPRSFRRGEAPDDNQTAFLQAEESAGRAHAVWDVDQLADAVAVHHRLSLREPLPPPISDQTLVSTMEALSTRLLDGRQR